MLPCVETKTKKLKEYQGIVPDKLLKEIELLSKDFNNLRVIMVNSTPYGGGVAEILSSLIPLMKGLGINAAWHVIPPDNDFFKITKEIHNALQGKSHSFSARDRLSYLRQMEKHASLMEDMKADILINHDPQPLGAILYLQKSCPAICRLHLDLTLPYKETWDFFVGMMNKYDKIIVSSKDYIKKDIKDKAIVFQPAIDPLTEKNQPFDLKSAKAILENFKINAKKPLIAQISRFDPWKDPLGVIDIFKIAKKKIPDLQLALIGLFLAVDDPEATGVFKKVKEKSKGINDIFLFSNINQLGNLSVDSFFNVFQTASDVVLQNSCREGFGLVVTEAMWKGKAVVAKNSGGIKLQINDGENGFLFSTPEEAAERIVQLIENPKLAHALGLAAKEKVRERFLMPRLLLDYLKLFKEIL